MGGSNADPDFWHFLVSVFKLMTTIPEKYYPIQRVFILKDLNLASIYTKIENRHNKLWVIMIITHNKISTYYN